MTTPDLEPEMVTISRADLDAMKAGLRTYRLAARRAEARRRIQSFEGPQTGGRLHSAAELAAAWDGGAGEPHSAAPRPASGPSTDS